MKKKIIGILLILTLAGGSAFMAWKYPTQFLGAFHKVKDKVEKVIPKKEAEELPPREPNTNAVTVNVDGNVYDIKDGVLRKNDFQLFKGKVAPKNNSLSIIDNVIYFRDDIGLARIDMNKKAFQPLYYDVYEFVAVSPKYVYGFRNGKVFKLDEKKVVEQIPELTYDRGMFEIVKNSIIFTSPENVNVFNMDTEENKQYPMSGKVVKYDFADGKLIVHTSTENIEIEV